MQVSLQSLEVLSSMKEDGVNMGLVTPMNPYTGRADLVDKTIGDAYDVCKYLYDNMEAVYAVASAIVGSNIGQPLLAQRGVLQGGSTGLKGVATLVNFEDLDINPNNILGSHVCIIGNTSGDKYFADSNTFSAKITSTGLYITVANSAPSECEEALIQWFIIYGG